jgi:undecaprenyl-diphosphatase
MMTDFLADIDRALFLVLHGQHVAWLDTLMWYVSEKYTWLPVYALLLILLYCRYPGKWFLLVVVMIAVNITLNDQLASAVFKDMVARLRPSHDPALEGMIQFVKEPNGQLYRGGLYGFYSSHAANYAGVVTFFILLMRPLRKFSVVLLLAWVLLISYSRIYLGVHFPGDVLMGLLMGTLIGWICFRVFKMMYQKFNVS